MDLWNYFVADNVTIVVNVFGEDADNINVNVYLADNKDVTEGVSVHDVMVEIPSV